MPYTVLMIIIEWTCLHLACFRGAPDDIINAMIDIGGKELSGYKSQ